MKRVSLALAVGILTYLSLALFEYFPHWWQVIIALVLAILGYKYIRSAIFMSLGMFGISMAYHSFPLFATYCVFVLVAALVALKIGDFPEMCLVIVAVPFLTYFPFFTQPIPIEFAVVFFAPVFFRGRRLPIIIGISCLLTAVVGIVGQAEFFGNLVIGMPVHRYFTLSSLPAYIYDFAWFIPRLMRFSAERYLIMPVNLIKFLISHPQITLTVIVWAYLGYLIGILLDKERWWIDFCAHLIGIVVLAGLQVLLLFLYPRQSEFNFPAFLIVLTTTATALFVIYEITSYFQRKEDPERAIKKATPLGKHKPKLVPVTAFTTTGGDYLKSQRLSLADTLRAQKALSDYIKKKFVQEATVLDIDVVESARLKHDESEENIIFSFNEYWRFIDGVVVDEQGRLLNRAGDGAVYMFNYADPAIMAAERVLKRLAHFNKKTNSLKLPFRVRIGLNTGKVVGEGAQAGSEIFSRTVDIAAHLQKMAEPAQVLITENTYAKLQRTKKHFEFLCEHPKDNVKVYAMKRKV